MKLSIDGQSLAGALRAGSSVVLRERSHLNEINVFPVPDADTGSNLAATLAAVARRFSGNTDAEIGKVAKAAADAALGGARGNSGAIFAQFLHGFAEAVHDATHIDTTQFAQAVHNGATSAYKAIFKPREGTILSVLHSWAESCGHMAQHVKEFPALLSESIKHAQNALHNTTEQLDVLKKNKVVDAGGQGFVYFLNGIVDFFHGRISPETLEFPEFVEASLGVDSESEHIESDSKYRYCTEALLTGENLDRDAIAALIEGQGDSQVLAGGGDLLKIHIHTDQPRGFFEKLADYGLISESKVDDMKLMQEPKTIGKTAIVIDSTCDVSEEFKANRSIYTVPLVINIRDRHYDDGLNISPASYYQWMRREKLLSTTSQPAVGSFIKTYSSLLDRYEQIISLHVTAASSGTAQAAASAADKVDAGRIRVVDTMKVSAGIAMLLEDAVAALENGSTVEETVSAIHAAREDIFIQGTTPTLEYAVRGGRVNARVAKVLEFLGLKPIITFDPVGKAHKGGIGFGMKGALKNMLKKARKFAGDKAIVDARVTHADNSDLANELADLAQEFFGLESVSVQQAGAVLGSHIGPGGVALSVRRG